jgi:hypothetical protein
MLISASESDRLPDAVGPAAFVLIVWFLVALIPYLIRLLAITASKRRYRKAMSSI